MLQTHLTRWNFQVDFGTLEEQLREQALAGVGMDFATLQRFLSNFIELIVIAIVAFFMLLDGKRIWNFALKAFPEHFRPQITEAIQHNFIVFFWRRLLLSIFFGVSIWVVFIILDLPFALVLAAIAGVFDLIPGIGATIGITLVFLIVLPQGIWLALQVLVGCVLLQQYVFCFI
ncbi:AI-2E family transporter [Scytonema millei]|uniref:AI-2E family transporter n=1 Tax=Scytonema millei TaxID=1245922 RepID=UPI000690497E|nr:AI-2E family transporter [Scytonema millei]